MPPFLCATSTGSPLLILALVLTAACSSSPVGQVNGNTSYNGSSGDTGSSGESGSPDETGNPPASAQDYRSTGPHSVQSSTQTVEVGSCSMDITLFTPSGDTSAPLLLLSHGFARSRANMAGWAEHYATWGFSVATPDLCHASLWDTDHSTNADDLIDLGQILGSDGVIYGGQSAGGLAALLAASRDVHARGVLGLDATDSESLGLTEAGDISAPVYGLVGEASDCNASNNGLDIYAAVGDARVLRVTEADHCDFEFDTDLVCTAFCQGSNSQFSDEEIQAAIMGLSTAALLDLAGQSEAGAGWWFTSGVYYSQLDERGIITVP